MRRGPRHRCVADAAAAGCRAVVAALPASLRDRWTATRGKVSPSHDCLRGPAGRATGSNTCRGGVGSPILRVQWRSIRPSAAWSGWTAMATAHPARRR